MSFPESYWAMVSFFYLLVRVLHTFQGLAIFLCVAYQILIFQNFGYHSEDDTEMFKQVQLITSILVVCGFRSNIVSPSDFNFFCFCGYSQSSLLCKGFLWLWRVGSSCCRAQAQSSSTVVVAHGLSRSVTCAIFLDQGSNLRPLH